MRAAICVLGVLVQSSKAPTFRTLLAGSGSTDISLVSDSCLDIEVAPKGAERYLHVGCHINPSAEQLFVFSRDGKLKGALYGWELVTLPDDKIVYHDSEVHFAPTHSLGISVFDPANGSDKKIYPPMPCQPVRWAFIARVAEVYKARGDDWFRQHNHNGNPELFDSRLEGDVAFDATHRAISFTVRYGDPDNGNDPLPFTELVNVTCSPLASLEQLRCVESARQERE